MPIPGISVYALNLLERLVRGGSGVTMISQDRAEPAAMPARPPARRPRGPSRPGR